MTSPDTLADRLEKAREAIAANTTWKDGARVDAAFYQLCFDEMPAILAALRSTASAREVGTIERCAKVADEAARDWNVVFEQTGDRAARDCRDESLQIAIDIRALAPPASPTTLAEPEAEGA